MIVSNSVNMLHRPMLAQNMRPDPDAVIDRGDDFVVAAMYAIKNADTKSVESAIISMSSDPERFSSTLKLAQEFLEAQATIEAPNNSIMEMD